MQHILLTCVVLFFLKAVAYWILLVVRQLLLQLSGGLQMLARRCCVEDAFRAVLRRPGCLYVPVERIVVTRSCVVHAAQIKVESLRGLAAERLGRVFAALHFQALQQPCGAFATFELQIIGIEVALAPALVQLVNGCGVLGALWPGAALLEAVLSSPLGFDQLSRHAPWRQTATFSALTVLLLVCMVS